MIPYYPHRAFNWYKIVVLPFLSRMKETCRHKGKTSVAGVVPPLAWEFFGGFLLGEQHSGSNSGLDLENAEVKSAKVPRRVEYQYHLDSCWDKFQKDISSHHAVVYYDDTYQNIEVYLIMPDAFAEHASSKQWAKKIRDAYEIEKPKDRCRGCAITYDFIRKRGHHIMSIVDDQLVV